MSKTTIVELDRAYVKKGGLKNFIKSLGIRSSPGNLYVQLAY